MERSSYGARRRRSGWWPSSKQSRQEVKRRRHEPVASVGVWLRKVTSGYYQYHAVPGNLHRLQLFRWRLCWLWWRALSRRRQRSRISMDRLDRFVDRWLPVPRVLPSSSYAALRRQSSKAGAVCVKAHVRICAGATSNDRPYRDSQKLSHKSNGLTGRDNLAARLRRRASPET